VANYLTHAALNNNNGKILHLFCSFALVWVMR
jgi:hypothetical protein